MLPPDATGRNGPHGKGPFTSIVHRIGLVFGVVGLGASAFRLTENARINPNPDKDASFMVDPRIYHDKA